MLQKKGKSDDDILKAIETGTIFSIQPVQKSETFVNFTKITAATWSVNKIIPVSIALI